MGLPCPLEPKRVILVRHGQSTWNADGRIQGSSDFSRLTAKVRCEPRARPAAPCRDPAVGRRRADSLVWAISLLSALPQGEAQAEKCRDMLDGAAFDVCFRSPLARARWFQLGGLVGGEAE